jgi:hypothetical protein
MKQFRHEALKLQCFEYGHERKQPILVQHLHSSVHPQWKSCTFALNRAVGNCQYYFFNDMTAPDGPRPPHFFNMNSQPSQRMFLCKYVKYNTTMTNHPIIPVRSPDSIQISNSLTDGSVAEMYRIGHQSQQIWTHFIIICGDAWKLWGMRTNWTQDKK